VQWFRGVFVCKAHRLLYRSTLGSRVTRKENGQANALGLSARELAAAVRKPAALSYLDR